VGVDRADRARGLADSQPRNPSRSRPVLVNERLGKMSNTRKVVVIRERLVTLLRRAEGTWKCVPANADPNVRHRVAGKIEGFAQAIKIIDAEMRG